LPFNPLRPTKLNFVCDKPTTFDEPFRKKLWVGAEKIELMNSESSSTYRASP
jgi:hypothetical protein